MKYRLPKGCAGVSLAGETLVVGRDRTIEADLGDAVALDTHGIVPCELGEAGAKPIDAMSRADLLSALETHGVETQASMSNAALRGLLRRAAGVPTA